ncbi:MAG: NADH-quinone oxidoreductase subunit NuoH [Zavarzinella sp.]
MTVEALLFSLGLIVVVLAAILGSVAYLTLAERKISAYVQDRVGPNRVGPWGLLQPMVDGIKFFFKEDLIPRHVDRVFYFLAPAVGVITALLAFSVVPFAPTPPPPNPTAINENLSESVATHEKVVEEYRTQRLWAVAPGLDVGILMSFAIASLVVYGVILGGWSSNSKYSLLGSLRASAQIISYEIPLGMSVLAVFLIAGSVNLEKIAAWQGTNGWFILYQPLGFVLFMISVYAECNRTPFDLPEAEQELVGGFHTEYGSMKLGLMLMVDYIHMITASFFLALLFCGGWHFPGISSIGGTAGIIAQFLVLGAKVFFFLMLFILVRWTIPRFKFDQLMSLAWQIMIPLCILNLLAVLCLREFGYPLWVMTPISLLLFVGAAWLTTRDKPREGKSANKASLPSSETVGVA